MDSVIEETQTKSQLDLLKERIEYDELIFGKAINYYEFVDVDENHIYTLKEMPEVGDMTYLYSDEEMVANKPIDSVNTHEETIDEHTIVVLDSIVIESVEYTSTGEVANITETYIKVLKRLLEDSKYVALSLRFPYLDYFDMELPKKYNNWQLRCCVEIFQGIVSEGIKSYS